MFQSYFRYWLVKKDKNYQGESKEKEGIEENHNWTEDTGSCKRAKPIIKKQSPPNQKAFVEQQVNKIFQKSQSPDSLDEH